MFIFAIFFIRCYYHELSGDELIYTFVWEKDDPTGLWDNGHRFETQAVKFTDILQTQFRHYREVNGRFILHTIEQLFTQKMALFSILNSAIFILFIWSITFYITDDKFNTDFNLWLTIAICLLYLFPYQESLWTSVNYGINYLWPATLTMATLILWRRLATVSPQKTLYIIGIVIIGFLTGCSNEAFSIGLSGGILFFYLIHFNDCKKSVLWLIIPLFIGTFLMAIAPGNIMRFTGEGCHRKVSLLWKIIHGLENFASLKVIWVTVLIFIIGIFSRKKYYLRRFFHSQYQLITILFITVLFTIVCNSRPHSAAFVELCALLLGLRYVYDIKLQVHRAIFKSLRITFSFIFVLLQIQLAYDTIKIYGIHSKMIDEYKSSNDGLIKVPNPPISQFSSPFLRGGDPTFWASVSSYIKGVYGKWDKDAIFYLENDYDALDANSLFYSPQFRCLGNAPIYHKPGGNYYWLNFSEHIAGDTYMVEYAPRNYTIEGPFYVKIKYALFPETKCHFEEVTWDTITTRFGTSYRLSIPFTENIVGFYKQN